MAYAKSRAVVGIIVVIVWSTVRGLTTSVEPDAATTQGTNTGTSITDQFSSATPANMDDPHISPSPAADSTETGSPSTVDSLGAALKTDFSTEKGLTTLNVMSGDSATGLYNTTDLAETVSSVVNVSAIPECKLDLTGADYRGTLAETFTGRVCQRWDEQWPHEHTDFPPDSHSHNYCRNIGSKSFTAWCYTTDPNVTYEFCRIGYFHEDCLKEVPKGPKECYTDSYGRDYQGTVSTTGGGYPCQKWSSQTPHPHDYTPFFFPDAGVGDHNYCRNVDDYDLPWCYTTSTELVWDYCNVGVPSENCNPLRTLTEDPNAKCKQEEVPFKGFCLGVVNSDEQRACNDTFSSESHPVFIKSSDIQEAIKTFVEPFVGYTALKFVIGLKNAGGPGEAADFRWLDGTPVVYNGFTAEALSNTEADMRCTYLDTHKQYQWDLYNCEAAERGTICQYDVDECSRNMHDCEQRCINTPGSYYCECNRGQRRHSSFGCIDICSVADSLTVEADTQHGTCLQFGEVESWSRAVKHCSNDNYKHLPRIKDFTDSGRLVDYLSRHRSNISTWPFMWLNLQNDTNDVFLSTSHCPIVNLTGGAAQLHWVPCDNKYAYFCLLDYSITRMQDMWESVISQVNLTTSYGYVESFSHAPWYDTNHDTSIVLHLSAKPGWKIRFLIHEMALRRETTPPYSCLDLLSFLDVLDEINSRPLCGSYGEFELMSTSGAQQIRYEVGPLDANMPAETGFSLTYDEINCEQTPCLTGCGSTSVITVNNSTVLTWPYPSSFPPYSHCSHHIAAPEGKYIALQFTEYNMTESMNGICEDTVRVVGIPSPSQREFIYTCQSNAPPLLISDMNSATVEVTTGLDALSRGFKANYWYSDKPGCFVGWGECSASELHCSTPEGVLASSNYPSAADPGSSCVWVINSAPNTYIHFSFINFTIPSRDQYCTNSYVHVIEKSFSGGDVTTVFCDTNPPNAVYYSRQNYLRIEIRLDASTQGAKFLAEYETVKFIPKTPIRLETDKAFNCPEGWDIYHGYCYQPVLNDMDLTWNEAEEKCTREGATSHLASIKDAGDMNFVFYQLTNRWSVQYKSTYIGLGNRNEKGIFRFSDGSPMSYTDWYIPEGLGESYSRQPNGGTLERCTVIIATSSRSTALWHDVPCASPEARQFICKQPATLIDAAFGNLPTSVLYQDHAGAPGCGPSLFTCRSGECIQQVYTCDGHYDCHDGSDETNCETGGSSCSRNQFQCSSGDQCISTSFYCDKIFQCEDNSDETECDYTPCSNEEFQCSDSSMCIPDESRCDLIHDCDDGSDEDDRCIHKSSGFQCYSGVWIPEQAKCDGMIDCIGNTNEDEPEQECAYMRTEHTCNLEDEMQCNNGKCANVTSLCMYDVDTFGFIIGCRDVTHLRNCSSFQCPAYTYKCPSSYCIPLHFRCNGQQDCPNGEDEIMCETDAYQCPTSSYSCRRESHEFQICLAPSKLCDGYEQCPQGDDELFCDFRCPVNCICVGLSVTCESSSRQREEASEFHPATRKLRITNLPVRFHTDNTTTMMTPEMTSDRTPRVHPVILLKLSSLPNLAELELISTSVKAIPHQTFRNNQNLYKLNLSGNRLTIIEDGTFDHLKNLQELDITNNQLVVGKTNQHMFKQLNNTLQILHTDSFSFCCLAKLDPESCHAPQDQFSSCNDLLKDTVLRVFIWILGISALVGNAFVLFLRLFQRRQVETTQVQANLISNLAVSDFMMGVYMLIIAIADQFYRGEYYLYSEIWQTSAVCKAAGFVSMLSSEVSVFFVMLISVDRILCVVFPFHRSIHMTSTSSRISIVAVWFVAFLLSLLPILIPSYTSEFYGRSSVCLALPLTSDRLPGWVYSIMIFLGINFFCFLLTLICYVIIYVTVKRSAERMANKMEQTVQSRRMQAQIKLAGKMALIVGTDFFCWMPIILMGILASSGVVQIPGEIYAWTAAFILPLNSSLNPYLYTISSLRQRRRQKRKSRLLTTTSGLQDVSTKASLDDMSVGYDAVNPCFLDLAGNCILTPFTLITPPTNLQTLSEYIGECDKTPSNVDSALIRQDIEKALLFLKTRGILGMQIAEENIAVQTNEYGAIMRAFLVIYNAQYVKQLIHSHGVKQMNNTMADGQEYIKNLLNEIQPNKDNAIYDP